MRSLKDILGKRYDGYFDVKKNRLVKEGWTINDAKVFVMRMVADIYLSIDPHDTSYTLDMWMYKAITKADKVKARLDAIEKDRNAQLPFGIYSSSTGNGNLAPVV